MQKFKRLKNMRAGELIILAGLVLLLVLHIERVIVFGRSILSVLMPLLVGVVIAYILNMIVKLIESIYFPNTKKIWLKKSRKAVSIVISIILVILLITLVLNLIIPQLIATVKLAVDQIPLFYEKVIVFIDQNIGLYNDLQNQMPSLPENIGDLLPDLFSNVTGGVLGIAGSAIGSAFGVIISIIFALYLLAARNTLLRQSDKIFTVYMAEESRNKLYSTLKITNETFSKFFAGQALEAVVLGALCTIGMLIFKLPYAGMIGTMVGITALIPLIGAYIGGAIGFIIIFPENIYQAIGFVVFLVILQQLEGSIVYPRVVGHSVGLPGIWVFASVIVGGGLFGIAGVLFGVPVAATVYKLIQNNVHKNSRPDPEEPPNGKQVEMK